MRLQRASYSVYTPTRTKTSYTSSIVYKQPSYHTSVYVNNGLGYGSYGYSGYSFHYYSSGNSEGGVLFFIIFFLIVALIVAAMYLAGNGE